MNKSSLFNFANFVTAGCRRPVAPLITLLLSNSVWVSWKPADERNNHKMVEKASVLSWRGSDQYYNPYIGRGEVLFTGELLVELTYRKG